MANTAAQLPITIHQGRSFAVRVVVSEPDLTNPGQWVPMDLSGYSAAAQVRCRPGGKVLLAEFEAALELVDDDDDAPGDARGRIDITADPDTTAGITRPGVWSLALFALGEALELVEGPVVMRREVTTI